MKKTITILSAVGALAAVSLVGSVATAQWAPPPPEYVASTEPIYYEGHAAYWYHGYWGWRDAHGAWNHYDHEPAFLAQRRGGGHYEPVRRSWSHR